MAASKYLVETYDQMLGRGEDKSAEAFTKGAMGVLQANAQQEAKTKANQKKQHDKDMGELESLGNLGSLSKEEKAHTRDWLRSKRDEYSNLSAQFATNKDPNIQDKMDEINESIVNAKSQIDLYNTQGTDYSQDKVAMGGSYDSKMHMDIWGKKGGYKFNLEDDGSTSFMSKQPSDEDVLSGKSTGGYESKKVSLNEIKDGWNVENSVVENLERKMRGSLEANKYEGKFFSKTKTQEDLYTSLLDTGPEGVQVFAETDLTGTYGNVDLSFKDLWANGMGDKSMYTKFPKDKGTDWMYDDNNSDYLAGLMAKHMANTHEELNKGYDEKSATYSSRPGTQSEIDSTRKMDQESSSYDTWFEDTSPGTHQEIVQYFDNIGYKKDFTGLEYDKNDKAYYITKRIIDDSDPLNLTYGEERIKVYDSGGNPGNDGLPFDKIWRFIDQDMVTLSSDNNIMIKQD